jgi:chaperonin cofactor prefoldin
MEALKEKLGDTEVALDTVNKDNEELRTKLEEMKNEA